MKIALFAGSFDPPSLGHLDIIQQASRLFDRVIVAVAYNHNKIGRNLFTSEERLQLLRLITRNLTNLEIASFSGLIVDFAHEKKATCLIRGIRTTSHLEHEFQMALANRKMGSLETLFLLGDDQHTHISSTLIREIAHANGPLKQFVPAEIELAIREKIKNRSLN